jgi:hypothetical protein
MCPCIYPPYLQGAAAIVLVAASMVHVQVVAQLMEPGGGVLQDTPGDTDSKAPFEELDLTVRRCTVSGTGRPQACQMQPHNPNGG